MFSKKTFSCWYFSVSVLPRSNVEDFSFSWCFKDRLSHMVTDAHLLISGQISDKKLYGYSFSFPVNKREPFHQTDAVYRQHVEHVIHWLWLSFWLFRGKKNTGFTTQYIYSFSNYEGDISPTPCPAPLNK